MASAQVAIDLIARDRASATFDRVGSAVDGAGKKTKASAAAFGFLGGAVAGFATTGLGAVKSWAGGAVDAFAAVEDATAAAGVQFGGATDSVVKFAEDAAKSFGLSKRAALDAQNEFGTFGKAAGLQEEELAKFSQGLTGLAGDLASFKGTSTEQAINAIGGALRGESEGMRAYGVLLSADAVAAEALSSGLAKTTKDLDAIKAAQFKAEEAQRAYNAAVKKNGEESLEAEKASIALTAAEKGLAKATEGANPKLTDQQKLMATQQLILKATGDAQGDYARTSTSTANVQKTLAAETENAQAQLGQKLAPVITKVRLLWLQTIRSLTGVGAAMGKVAEFAKNNQGALKAVGAVVAVVIVPALAAMVTGWVRAGVAAPVNAAKQVAAWLATQAAAYKSAAVMVATSARIVGAYVLIGVQAMAAAVRTRAAMILATGAIGIAVAAIAGAVFLIVKHWDTIKAKTVAAFNVVKSAIGKAISFVTGLFLNFTGPGLIIKHFDTIINFVKGVPGKLAAAGKGMFDWIVDAVKAPINLAIGALRNFGIPAFKVSIPLAPDFTFGGLKPFGGIPLLADGGIVTKPTLAVIGEAGPEAVVPLGRDMGTGTVVNVTINGALDPVSVGRQIDMVMAKYTASGGRLNFLPAT